MVPVIEKNNLIYPVCLILRSSVRRFDIIITLLYHMRYKEFRFFVFCFCFLFFVAAAVAAVVVRKEVCIMMKNAIWAKMIAGATVIGQYHILDIRRKERPGDLLSPLISRSPPHENLQAAQFESVDFFKQTPWCFFSLTVICVWDFRDGVGGAGWNLVLECFIFTHLYLFGNKLWFCVRLLQYES